MCVDTYYYFDRSVANAHLSKQVECFSWGCRILSEELSCISANYCEVNQLASRRVCWVSALSNEDILKKTWDEAQIRLSSEENEKKSSSIFRMDVIWGYLSSLKLGNESHKFHRISDIAKTVLILPHTNAGEKRVFSLIWKNIKTTFLPSLQVDGTLAFLPQIPSIFFPAKPQVTKAWNSQKFFTPTWRVSSLQELHRNHSPTSQ